jgi:hypothetical protein
MAHELRQLPSRSLELATMGRDVLATYIGDMIQLASQHDDLEALLYYRYLADLISEFKTGLVLGSLLYEARLITHAPKMDTPIPDVSQDFDFYSHGTIKIETF